MASTRYTRARAHYAGLVRMRPADDPELPVGRQRMEEEAVVAAVEKALAKAPPLSDELRQKIIAMLG